jgi:hypothetical protein
VLECPKIWLRDRPSNENNRSCEEHADTGKQSSKMTQQRLGVIVRGENLKVYNSKPKYSAEYTKLGWLIGGLRHE